MATPQFPRTFDCGIRLGPQDRSEDCWADCAAAVLTYLGVRATQDEVRQRAIGGADRPLPWPDVARVFGSYGVTGIGPEVPLAAVVLRDELIAGRPVLVGYQWRAGGGHVALVVGWRAWTGRFLIQDPFFGPGELSYVELLTGYGVGQWSVCWGRFKRKERS